MSLFWISTGNLHSLYSALAFTVINSLTTSLSSLVHGRFINCTFIHALRFNVWKKNLHILCQRDSPTLSSPLNLNTNSASLVSQLAGFFGATEALGANSAITRFTIQIPGFWQRARKKKQFLSNYTKVNIFMPDFLILHSSYTSRFTKPPLSVCL